MTHHVAHYNTVDERHGTMQFYSWATRARAPAGGDGIWPPSTRPTNTDGSSDLGLRRRAYISIRVSGAALDSIEEAIACRWAIGAHAISSCGDVALGRRFRRVEVVYRGRF